MEKNKSIPNYLNIFEKRILDQVDRIKEELKKPKKSRNKKLLRMLLHDIKKVKKAVEVAKEDHAVKCPHCHKRL
jgi:hypothetical protein